MTEQGDEDKKYVRKDWVGCDEEEHYFGDAKRLSKEDRKRRQATDRSKYKKTDMKQLAKKNAAKVEDNHENLLHGRVLSIQSEGITVDYEGSFYTCTLRGLMKKEKGSLKNLVTVGDIVLFEKLSDKEGVIEQVEPRTSVLSRADNLSRRKQQLIASNIDLVLITASVVMPPLKPPLVDRYIIATVKGGMTPVVIINKVDLFETMSLSDPHVAEQRELYYSFLDAYERTGIQVISLSADTGEGLDALRAVMKGKTSVFSGQSGVGKSSLINQTVGLDLPVGDMVEHTRKGAHTTTMAQLIPLEFGGWCIDTPGIKSFGVWNLEKKEIEEHYTEIYEIGRECKFPNCSHTHETECAVKEAVAAGEINPLRYESYVALLETIDDDHKRR